MENQRGLSKGMLERTWGGGGERKDLGVRASKHGFAPDRIASGGGTILELS